MTLAGLLGGLLWIGLAQLSSLPVRAAPTTPTSSERDAEGVVQTTTAISYPIVFVSRQIPDQGSIYWDEPKGIPGVGPYSRFQVAAPGKLLIREVDGTVRALIDGANPAPATLNLIDVNAPAVSYDSRTIVFAGLPAGSYSTNSVGNPGAWRIYTIQADGSGLRQVTTSDQQLDLPGHGLPAGLSPYDDTDPVWLPDGRIVFSSTRWPGYGHYSGVRVTNLYVINPDGSDLRRITSERNGADRPLIDPLTGKIVYSRWWRNHRFASESMDTILDENGAYRQHDGLTISRSNHVGGSDFLWRNKWHAAAINPDGTDLEQWGGNHHKNDANHIYGGAFTPNGQLVANYFPMTNMTEAAGFGGLRRFDRGFGYAEPIIGVTKRSSAVVNQDPPSYGIQPGSYASEPAVLPDGRLIFSWAPDIYQDYGLYIAEPDGSKMELLYDNPGTSELRAQVRYARALPPIITDTITATASLLPPPAEGPYDQDGVFTYDALNVYFNAPVDSGIGDAPPVGSADVIRFFIDHQRASTGSYPQQDWPIMLKELPVAPDGSVQDTASPANVPLFEQIRSADGSVPFTGNGATHVAGMNFAPPGAVARCVGCHAGHTMIPVPDDPEAARFTNLAPGATVAVSSEGKPGSSAGLTNRRVFTGEPAEYWISDPTQDANGQWVTLTFPVPVAVQTVRLYAQPGADGQIQQATVVLYEDVAATQPASRNTITTGISSAGTNIEFPDVTARVVRVELDQVSGQNVAGLAEIEVIARGEDKQ
jgi:hypothetical protein